MKPLKFLMPQKPPYLKRLKHKGRRQALGVRRQASPTVPNGYVRAGGVSQRLTGVLSQLGLSFLFLFFIILQPYQGMAQASRDNGRLIAIGATGAVLYGGSLIVLNQYWYKNYPKSKFHFFNDNDEWMQMDKAGHLFTSYYEGYYGMEMLRWAGVPRDKAIWYGGTWGLLFQTPIEIMDGFSSKWGFSWGDALANTLGTALLIGQEYTFGEQRFRPKFGFYPTEFSPQNPNLFGSSLPENMIKDYNGQSYWLSTPVNSFAPNNYIPTWFCISFGIGATGMTRGTAKDQDNDHVMHPEKPYYQRDRKFFLAFDVNLSGIDTKNKTANTALDILSWIKVPSPTIEYSRYRGFKAHLLYF
jgi:uncharacterized protein YfiM (DUF2279 family)